VQQNIFPRFDLGQKRYERHLAAMLHFAFIALHKNKRKKVGCQWLKATKTATLARSLPLEE